MPQHKSVLCVRSGAKSYHTRHASSNEALGDAAEEQTHEAGPRTYQAETGGDEMVLVKRTTAKDGTGKKKVFLDRI